MVTAKQLVTSLEISQRLKELGVPQGQSYFIWFSFPDLITLTGEIRQINSYHTLVIPRDFSSNFIPEEENKTLCDAFTLSELYRFDDITRNMAQVTDFKTYFYEVQNNLINRIERNIVAAEDLKL